MTETNAPKKKPAAKKPVAVAAAGDMETLPVEPVAAAETGAVIPAAPVATYAVVGAGETDAVLYSRAVRVERAKTRKSLTVHHLQRRLVELGYDVAGVDVDGRYGAATVSAVESWQTANGEPSTGDLTREQFAAVFAGDPNVSVVLD